MIPVINEIQILEDYKLLLKFGNNEWRFFDMEQYLDKGLFKELKNKKTFSTVEIKFNTLQWSNGIDLDPEELYKLSSNYNKLD